MNEQSERDVHSAPTEKNGYPARVDHEVFHVLKPHPTGTDLLALVHKKPCAFELIEVFHDHERTNVVLPDERVDLRKPGLKGYLSAHREIVDIYLMSEKPLPIQRGTYSVAQMLDKAGVSPETHMLLQEVDGQPPLPVPPTEKLDIKGCEVFYVQPQTGGSS